MLATATPLRWTIDRCCSHIPGLYPARLLILLLRYGPAAARLALKKCLGITDAQLVRTALDAQRQLDRLMNWVGGGACLPHDH